MTREGWTRWYLLVSSNPNHSMILCIYSCTHERHIFTYIYIHIYLCIHLHDFLKWDIMHLFLIRCGYRTLWQNLLPGSGNQIDLINPARSEASKEYPSIFPTDFCPTGGHWCSSQGSHIACDDLRVSAWFLFDSTHVERFTWTVPGDW